MCLSCCVSYESINAFHLYRIAIFNFIPFLHGFITLISSTTLIILLLWCWSNIWIQVFLHVFAFVLCFLTVSLKPKCENMKNIVKDHWCFLSAENVLTDFLFLHWKAKHLKIQAKTISLSILKGNFQWQALTFSLAVALWLHLLYTYFFFFKFL